LNCEASIFVFEDDRLATTILVIADLLQSADDLVTEDDELLVAHDRVVALHDDQSLHLAAESMIELFFSFSDDQTRFLSQIDKFDMKLLKSDVAHVQSSELALDLDDAIEVEIDDRQMSQNLLIVSIDLRMIETATSQNVLDRLVFQSTHDVDSACEK